MTSYSQNPKADTPDLDLGPNLGSERLSSSSEVSLGNSVVCANGLVPRAEPVYVVHNLIPGLRWRGGPPVQIDAEPDDNKASNLLVVPSLSHGERAITSTPPPGVIDYYLSRGILESADQVVSFNCQLKNGRSTGFPHFDPLSLAVRAGASLGPGYFVSAYTSEFIRDQARQLGLNPVQVSDSFETNDKISFGDNAARYGYSVCPRVVLRTPADILQAASEFRDTPCWVKFSHASGGDLLFSCAAPTTVAKIVGAVDRIRASVREATLVNTYGGQSLEGIWPENSPLPIQYGICVERDARYIGGTTCAGKVLSTGSNLMKISSSGEVEVSGYFEQIVGPAGDFWGSRSIDPLACYGAEVKEDLDRQFQAIGRYCVEKLNLFGLVGVDYMVIETPSGNVQSVMIEMNGRPPLSACSHIVGTQKLGAPAWISRYMWAPEAICAFSDFEDLVSINGRCLAHAGVADGLVFPMFISSVFQEDRDGNYNTLVKKRWMQVLVAGESHEHCQSIFELLNERKGVSYLRPSKW